jgi:hypothetical protein
MCGETPDEITRKGWNAPLSEGKTYPRLTLVSSRAF